MESDYCSIDERRRGRTPSGRERGAETPASEAPVVGPDAGRLERCLPRVRRHGAPGRHRPSPRLRSLRRAAGAKRARLAEIYFGRNVIHRLSSCDARGGRRAHQLAHSTSRSPRNHLVCTRPRGRWRARRHAPTQSESYLRDHPRRRGLRPRPALCRPCLVLGRAGAPESAAAGPARHRARRVAVPAPGPDRGVCRRHRPPARDRHRLRLARRGPWPAGVHA